MSNIPMSIITKPNSNIINITLNFPTESILFIHLFSRYLLYVSYVLGIFLTVLWLGEEKIHVHYFKIQAIQTSTKMTGSKNHSTIYHPEFNIW